MAEQKATARRSPRSGRFARVLQRLSIVGMLTGWVMPSGAAANGHHALVAPPTGEKAFETEAAPVGVPAEAPAEGAAVATVTRPRPRHMDRTALVRGALAALEAPVEAVPAEFVRSVDGVIAGLQRAGHDDKIWRQRMETWPQAAPVFAEAGVPEMLAHLMWPESGYDPLVCSPMGARGPWQLMPISARAAGLVVTGDCAALRSRGGRPTCRGRDDRIDVRRSTMGAARILQGLMVEYGHRDTLLAIAAYNSGPYKIHGILKRSGLKNHGPGTFWELYRRRLLPRESVNLVVRVVALTTMAVERLGLPTAPSVPTSEPSGVSVSAREVPRSVRAIAPTP